MIRAEQITSPFERAAVRMLEPISEIVERVLARHPARKPKRIRKERRRPLAKIA